MEYKPQPDRYTNGMLYRRCGDSGIQLPVISLGFWHNFGNTDCYATGLELVEYAFDHGVCHFDLANNYGPPAGSAEENFGRMMKCSLRRKPGTKCGPALTEDAAPAKISWQVSTKA